MSNKDSAFLAAQVAAHRLIGRPLRCFYCNIEIVVMAHAEGVRTPPHAATVDHWTPKARGGTNAACNLFLACSRCNTLKGCMTGEEFIPIMDDEQQCLRIGREWSQKLNPQNAKLYPTARDRIAAKVARREERLHLTQRITVPNPDCEWCSGSGRHRNRGIDRPCPCSITRASEEDNACTRNG